MRLLLILFFIHPFYSLAQSGEITGRITHQNEPVIGVNVGIITLHKGSTTDGEGYFTIKNLPAGTYQLQVSALGYKTETREVIIESGNTTIIHFELEESIEELPQFVVTGTMRETLIKDTPVKVQVLSNEYLQKNPSANLMDNISYINGLYEQVGCGVCGTNSVRINGMEGPYTSLLIDGMPIMGSLASVYGFNGINPAIIETVEITKGPNSTLYGSEAMGGVINIRTKEPDQSERLNFDVYGTTHREGNVDISFVPETSNFNTLFSGNLHYFDHFIDDNNDGFADLTKRTRLSLFNKWTFNPADKQELNLAYKLYYEDRLGGIEEYSRAHLGSPTIYGEAIKTGRLEFLGRYDLSVKEEIFRAEFSYSYHDQDSYYGDYRYQANQNIFFSNLLWDKQFTSRNLLITGISTKFDKLEQLFDERYLESGSEDNRFVPGVFAQYERVYSDTFRSLLGLRMDYYNKHGFIFSPRFNLKLDAGDHTTVRFNAGTGFRIVNIFTEQHEVLSGSRVVEIQEELKPERSINATLNINQIIDIGVSVLNVDIDLFYTHFSNQIIPDYSIPNKILYSNLDGHAVTRGISVSAAHNFPGPLMYSVGFTLQDVFQQRDGIRQPILHAPNWSSVFSLSYAFKHINTSVDWTGRIVGEMNLPEYPGYPNTSDAYTEQNIKLTKPISPNWTVHFTIKNMLNYTQKNPIVAPDRPFSDDFATDRVFGPLQGRRALIGIQYKI